FIAATIGAIFMKLGRAPTTLITFIMFPGLALCCMGVNPSPPGAPATNPTSRAAEAPVPCRSARRAAPSHIDIGRQPTSAADNRHDDTPAGRPSEAPLPRLRSAPGWPARHPEISTVKQRRQWVAAVTLHHSQKRRWRLPIP